MRIIKNSRGTTLVQVMVSIGLMGIISIGFATMMGQMSASQQLIQAKQDLANIVDETQMMFSNPASCVSGIPTGSTFDLARAAVRFPAATGQPAFAFTGQPFVFQLNGSQVLRSNSTLAGSLLQANNVQLVNADLVGTDEVGRSVYKAKLIGQFSARTEGNPMDLRTRILASGYFVVDPSNQRVVGCSDFNTADLNQISMTCVALGGSYDATTKKCSMPVNLAELCTQLSGTLNNGRCEITPGGGTVASTEGSWAPTGTSIHSAFAYQYQRCPADLSRSCTRGQSCLAASAGGGISISSGLYQCL